MVLCGLFVIPSFQWQVFAFLTHLPVRISMTGAVIDSSEARISSTVPKFSTIQRIHLRVVKETSGKAEGLWMCSAWLTPVHPLAFSNYSSKGKQQNWEQMGKLWSKHKIEISNRNISSWHRLRADKVSCMSHSFDRKHC